MLTYNFCFLVQYLRKMSMDAELSWYTVKTTCIDVTTRWQHKHNMPAKSDQLVSLIAYSN